MSLMRLFLDPLGFIFDTNVWAHFGRNWEEDTGADPEHSSLDYMSHLAWECPGNLRGTAGRGDWEEGRGSRSQESFECHSTSCCMKEKGQNCTTRPTRDKRSELCESDCSSALSFHRCSLFKIHTLDLERTRHWTWKAWNMKHTTGILFVERHIIKHLRCLKEMLHTDSFLALKSFKVDLFFTQLV